MNLDTIKQKTHIVIEGITAEPQDILCNYTPISLSFNDKEKLYIEEVWNEARKSNPFLFDGQLFHVQNYSVESSKKIMMFNMYKSSFKEYIGSHSINFRRLFGQNKLIRSISVGTMIITSDNKWIVGQRLHTYEFEGYYALIAGDMDPTKDLFDSKPDPFFAIKREMREEAGIQEKDIDNITCIGLDGTEQLYLAFFSTLTLSFEELVSQRAPTKKEFLRLESFELTKETIENFLLTNYSRITPHALANILMYYSAEF